MHMLQWINAVLANDIDFIVIIIRLNIKNLDWILSYQSRVGPLKWIGPSTEEIIIENSKLGKHIVLVPIAFV